MPSGAKKRKAAKKKLHNNKPHQHNHINESNASQSHGSDCGDVGREVTEETAVKSYDGESSFTETAKEVNPAECYNGDASEERKNSSGSSSSDDDEVDVEKNKPVVGVGDEMVKSDDGVTDVGSSGKGVGAEVVEETVDESIPVEETVKEVVSLDPVGDGVPDVVDSELNPRLTEVLPASGEKVNVLFEVDLGQEKAEAKEIPILDNGLGNSSICADNTARDVENGGDGHVKETEKVQNSEEQPLISSAPLPVRRTSWMNCCGLFEVISGGSGR